MFCSVETPTALYQFEAVSSSAVLTPQQQEAVLRASMAHRPNSRPQEAEIATFTLSLSLQRVTLHQALEAALARPAGAALPSVQSLFERLLHVWEGIRAAEERMAAEEAELFKNKTQTSGILTEEVSNLFLSVWGLCARCLMSASDVNGQPFDNSNRM